MSLVKTLKIIGFAALAATMGPAFAAVPAPVVDTAAPTVESAAPDATATDAATPAADAAAPAGSYTPMKPTPGKGMPEPGHIDFQDQYSELGQYAYAIHNYMLLPIITVISLFVLLLLLWVVVRYRAKANPEPSKVTHNSLIEVIWTAVPVLILVAIAFPSLDLLAKQYKPAPEDALTIKVTGYQWYWGYTYPDNGDFEVISNMLSDEQALARGEPGQLAVDNRMVVPAGVPIKLQITAADVIHSFAVPSLWFKMDAVPGRLNERTFKVEEPGVYYGQCSELCGARHSYMPIVVEALPMEKYNQWVLAQGGTIKGAAQAAAAAATEAPAAGDAPATAAPAEAAPAS